MTSIIIVIGKKILSLISHKYSQMANTEVSR